MTVEIETHRKSRNAPSRPILRTRRARSEHVRVAIVGCGANGVAVLHELVRAAARTSAPHAFEIDVYESASRPGAGLAYGTTLEAHILNMRSSTMSAVADDPTHFLAWLLRRARFRPAVLHLADAEAFVPRRVFGEYLMELFRESVQMATAIGIAVRILPVEARAVRRIGNRVAIDSAATRAPYHHVLLCLGNQPPPAVPDLDGRPGYIPHAWPETRLMQSVPRDAHVLILGSGLTAVDAFLTLQENGHEGRIIFASRHGFLPKVRGYAAPYQLTHLTSNAASAIRMRRPLVLADLAALFLRELHECGVLARISEERMTRLCRRALLLFRIHVRRAAVPTSAGSLRHDIDAVTFDSRLFSMLKALDEIVGELWNGLSIEDRQAFDRHFLAAWNSTDYPTPRQNAQKLAHSLEWDALTVHRLATANATRYDEDRGLFVTECLDAGGKPISVESDCVVNGIGQSLRVTAARAPLLRDAVERGLLVAHPLGGVDVDFDTCAAIDHDGVCDRRLFVVGSLTRGVHFYTNSINENAKCGRRAVAAVMSELWPQLTAIARRRDA